jgi:hypothetical protein
LEEKMEIDQLFDSHEGVTPPLAVVVSGHELKTLLRLVKDYPDRMTRLIGSALARSIPGIADTYLAQCTVALNKIIEAEELDPKTLAEYLYSLAEVGPALREWLSTRLDEELDSLNRTLTYTPRHLSPN